MNYELWTMYHGYSKRIPLIVKCSCHPMIYDTLILFVHNNDNNNNTNISKYNVLICITS